MLRPCVTTKNELLISSCVGSRLIRSQGNAVVGNGFISGVVDVGFVISTGAVVVS